MSFDIPPDNYIESHPCPECDAGNVTLQNGLYECDVCDFKYIPSGETK